MLESEPRSTVGANHSHACKSKCHANVSRNGNWLLNAFYEVMFGRWPTSRAQRRVGDEFLRMNGEGVDCELVSTCEIARMVKGMFVRRDVEPMR
jgi:hypothetical protein